MALIILAMALYVLGIAYFNKSKPIAYKGKIWDSCDESTVIADGNTNEMLNCYHKIK